MPAVTRLLTGLTLSALVAAGATLAHRAILHVDPPAGVVPGPVLRGTVEVGGRERGWVAYVPSRPAARPPLVLALHPAWGDGESMRVWTGYELEALAERDGFVVAYPHAGEDGWTLCGEPAAGAGADDVAFLRALVDRLGEALDVDHDHVFAFGYSRGGRLALRLAIEAPDLVAAVAVVGASLPVPGHGCAPPSRPLPVFIAHGTADPVAPFEGGRPSLPGLGDRGEVRPVADTARTFARLAGHPDAPRIVHLPDVDADGSWIERRTWGGRPEEGPEVTLFAVHGGGHTLPQRRVLYPRLLGRTNRDVSVPAEAWALFARQR